MSMSAMTITQTIIEALKIAGLSMSSVFAVLGIFFFSIKIMNRVFK